MDTKQVYDAVQKHYSTAAGARDADYARKVAESFGYTKEELADIPTDTNLGLSCGNPLAIAKLEQGETVLDLGSGAGFDVFRAAKNVGPAGKVIGDMLERANQNKEKAKADNVSFVESYITDIKLPDGIADCIISNCVVNLVPETDKQLVFNEMFRLLKPQGRVAISDILAKKPLTQEIRDSVALYVGCIAGASEVKNYEKYLREAGFTDFLLVDTKSDLNIYTTAKSGSKGPGCCSSDIQTCCEPSDSSAQPKPDVENIDFNEWAGSFKIYAVKS
ncbi:hypothetical protein FQN57_002063 [Myotisia sp. PD_48]|nr:hypothetical protein FQN57_002063 [Myotisia sp. PD_48]